MFSLFLGRMVTNVTHEKGKFSTLEKIACITGLAMVETVPPILL